VTAPASNSASSSRFLVSGELHRDDRHAISTAITAPHARVRMPSRTQSAPTVSIAMTITAKIVGERDV